MFGRGAHGSMPQASIDPVVMSASTVLRLQTIVSRELAPNEAAVVTVGSLQAGTKENVIPDEAVIKLNVRTFDEGVRKRVLAAIERIVNAEAEASGAPKKPEITTLDRYSLVKNDPEAVKRAGDDRLPRNHGFDDAQNPESRSGPLPGKDLGHACEWMLFRRFRLHAGRLCDFGNSCNAALAAGFPKIHAVTDTDFLCVPGHRPHLLSERN